MGVIELGPTRSRSLHQHAAVGRRAHQEALGHAAGGLLVKDVGCGHQVAVHAHAILLHPQRQVHLRMRLTILGLPPHTVSA